MNQIISFSIIVWIFIDRFKKLWEQSKYSSIITSGVALLSGLLIAFFYHLDLLLALELVDYPSIGGQIFAALAIMGGSSCINEILKKLNFKGYNVQNGILLEVDEVNEDAE